MAGSPFSASSWVGCLLGLGWGWVLAGSPAALGGQRSRAVGSLLLLVGSGAVVAGGLSPVSRGRLGTFGRISELPG